MNQTTTVEQWKEIKGFYNYFASSHGRIASTYIKGLRGEFGKDLRVLKYSICGSGYRTVHLYKDKKRYTKMIHRLVAQAFLGQPCMVVNHKDLNKQNNAVENLEYVSYSQNVKHSIANGVGKNPPIKRKLTDENLDFIMNTIGKLSHAECARILGVNASCVSRTRRGESNSKYVRQINTVNI